MQTVQSECHAARIHSDTGRQKDGLTGTDTTTGVDNPRSRLSRREGPCAGWGGRVWNVSEQALVNRGPWLAAGAVAQLRYARFRGASPFAPGAAAKSTPPLTAACPGYRGQIRSAESRPDCLAARYSARHGRTGQPGAVAVAAPGHRPGVPRQGISPDGRYPG